MQKKLIALAVASLASGAAFAQTNVTMYGIADAGYVYSQGDALVSGTNEFSGVQSGLLSGSRIGFKGEEALGNGLKAIFTLEYSLSIDNNSGIGNTQGGGLNARQQFVGLSGGFGTVALGRQYSPGYMATVNNDPAGGAAFEPQSFMTAQAGNTITPNSGARWDNALTYTSPNWGGFTGKAIYSFGENSSCTVAGTPPTTFTSLNDNCVSLTDNGRWALGANFATGAFNVDAVYQSRQSVMPVGVVSNSPFWGDDINEWYVGGSFDLKFVKLMASYQDQDDKNATNNDNSTWTVGAVVPLGNFGIHLQYAQTDFDQGLIDGKSNGAMVAGTYALSKRTTAYAGYVWTKNDNDSMGLGPVGGVGASGETNNTFTVGVRHAF
ncbi:MAG: porin [Candidatus Accumulibacter sp. UW26]|jgi:predicted porin